MSLRPLQLAALGEAANGLFGNLPVGSGKTLVALLLPTVLKAERTVLLTKSRLVDQLLRHYEEYSKHWRLPKLDQELFIVNYESLSSQKGRNVLNEIQPELVICDETHCVAGRSVRTHRFKEFFKKHPAKLIALSGTLMTKPMLQVAPIANLCLKDKSPYPRNYPDQELWGRALDFLKENAPPGVLNEFRIEGESVRDGFRRRVVESEGVIAGAKDQLGITLMVKGFHPGCGKEITKLLKKQNETWETPDGEFILTPLEKWRRDGELSCGFFYKRTWPNGESKDLQEEWLSARKEWRKEVSSYLKKPKNNIDSPGLYEKAVRAGIIESAAASRWFTVKNHCKPSKEAVWVTDGYFLAVLDWCFNNPKAVLWYEHQAFGLRLAEVLGDEALLLNEDLPNLQAEGTKYTWIVASRPAIGTGTDGLQLFGNKQLFTWPSSSAEVWEQALGRMHRVGQTADEVETHIALHTTPAKEAFRTAVKEARHLNENMKLSYCNMEDV